MHYFKKQLLPESWSQDRGLGGVRLAHNLSIDSKYLMSSKKNLPNSLLGSYSDCCAHARVEVRVTFPASSDLLCKATEPASPSQKG